MNFLHEALMKLNKFINILLITLFNFSEIYILFEIFIMRN
jgi:hypothetical protein